MAGNFGREYSTTAAAEMRTHAAAARLHEPCDLAREVAERLPRPRDGATARPDERHLTPRLEPLDLRRGERPCGDLGVDRGPRDEADAEAALHGRLHRLLQPELEVLLGRSGACEQRADGVDLLGRVVVGGAGDRELVLGKVVP